jgi:pyrroloquinoline-quinone synthase
VFEPFYFNPEKSHRPETFLYWKKIAGCHHLPALVYWLATKETAIMTTAEFFQQLDARIAKYDLLCHPFYKAWAAGELTRADLREYACDYYHHVKAFPSYLAQLSVRLEESELRRAVLANMADEDGLDNTSGEPSPPHSDLWLDFVEGMGADRNMLTHQPLAEVGDLIEFFHKTAQQATPAEALAAFYAYESQVPRVAQEKARGLREIYGASEKTCGYFTLHATADIYHSQIWRHQLAKCVESDPNLAEGALTAGERAAKALWRALDGIDQCRTARAA